MQHGPGRRDGRSTSTWWRPTISTIPSAGSWSTSGTSPSRKRLGAAGPRRGPPPGHHHRVAGRRGDDGRCRRDRGPGQRGLRGDVRGPAGPAGRAAPRRPVGRRAGPRGSSWSTRTGSRSDVDDHPVLASLRGGPPGGRGRPRAPAPGAPAHVGPGQHPGHARRRRRGHRGRGLVQRHHRGPPGRRRAAAGGAVPPGAARHPRRGHRGLRRRGPDHRVQPGRPAAPRPRRGRPIPSGASPPTRGSAGPTGRPWTSGRTR